MSVGLYGMPSMSVFSGGGRSAAATYLPDEIVALAKAIYSTRKVVSGYAGAGIRLYRDSDAAESDFSFVGQDLDLDAITAWAPGQKRVAKWYDQSGNARDITQTTNTKMPTFEISSPNTRDGKATVVLSGLHSAPDMMVIPASVVVDPQDFSVYQVGGAKNQYLTSPYLYWPTFVGFGADGPTTTMVRYNADGTGPYMGVISAVGIGNHKIRCGQACDSAFSILTTRGNASELYGQIDDFAAATTSAAFDHADSAGGRLNENYSEVGGGGAGECRFMGWFTRTDDTQHTDLKSALRSIFPEVPATPTSHLFWFGDSLSAGYIGFDQRWLSPMNRIAQSLPTTRCRCAGRAGRTLTQIQQDLIDNLINTNSQIINETAKPRAVVMGGYNDFALGADAATAHTRLEACCDTLTAAGYVVAVCLLPPSSTLTGNAEIGPFNDLIQANYLSYASYLIDLESPDYTGLRDVDGIHFTEAGYALLGTTALPTIQAMIAA